MPLCQLPQSRRRHVRLIPQFSLEEPHPHKNSADNLYGVHLVTMHRVYQPLTELWGLGLHRFGVNLTIEEEKVEFPKGKDNIKMYSVRSIPVISSRSPKLPRSDKITHNPRIRRHSAEPRCSGRDPVSLRPACANGRSTNATLARYFCQTCGVPIMSITPLYKGKIVLKLGLSTKLLSDECLMPDLTVIGGGGYDSTPNSQSRNGSRSPQSGKAGRSRLKEPSSTRQSLDLRREDARVNLRDGDDDDDDYEK
ncbi:uncharacterized protein Z519_01062 [Cladophialophora bantiana CBS 173.52]|uniref:Uncharacterized protein n=1 Tax=Cladophialophora bantiana (strain ATCC 10958 / CBS 173.52 / CDC B-1940 / NIH 8579) TaxID=1442370 RepID=A0A0D2HVU2_CLAB1|nr:uncharacterized protein Z519_01062 [Cladophialophora bantiana CBS 173.52]KIW97478.1 hypothetical protein Z519_01062 [Cladophialophora bantiana CBS 173.52]